MSNVKNEQGNCSRLYKILKVYKKTRSSSCYVSELKKLKKPDDNRHFSKWMTELMDCISILKESTNFIRDLILDVPWQVMSKTDKDIFCQFILCLVTAHNGITYDVIDALFLKLKFDKDSFSKEESMSNYPESVIPKRKEESEVICNLICAVVKAIPLAYEGLRHLVRKCRPHTNAPPVCHIMFLYNILLLAKMLPSDRITFLLEIFHQITALDLVVDRDQLEDCSDENFTLEYDSVDDPNISNYRNNEPAVKSLDAMMVVMFRYIHSTMHGKLEIDELFKVKKTHSVNSCRMGSISYANRAKSFTEGCECGKKSQNENMCKLLYFEMRTIFMQMTLPTYLSAHSQYLMFYLLAIRPSFMCDFIDFLNMNFESHNNSLELRRNALAYIGSFLARGRFIPFKVMYSVLEIISKFCLSYIRKEYDIDLDSTIHAPFYYSAQVLFYVFTFRYKEFTRDAESLMLARALHLDSIVNSHMNPLKNCLSAVAINFAAVSCHFQLAYCYAVMEKNDSFSLNVHNDQEVRKVEQLEFLPFEPYLLPRSAHCVLSHFVEFCGLDEEIKLRPTVCGKRKRSDSSSYNFLSCSPEVLDTSF